METQTYIHIMTRSSRRDSSSLSSSTICILILFLLICCLSHCCLASNSSSSSSTGIPGNVTALSSTSSSSGNCSSDGSCTYLACNNITCVTWYCDANNTCTNCTANLPGGTYCADCINGYGGSAASCTVSVVASPPVVQTTAEILGNASCPTVWITNTTVGQKSNASLALSEFDGANICIGGAVDDYYTCTPGAVANQHCANDIQEGRNTDSLYSLNPPAWWRCTYTDPVTGNLTTGLQVVDPTCFTDSANCVPRRYMTTINNLNNQSQPQWPGQQFPPYAQFDTPPLAIVMAGAAWVNATLFYPEVDVLQLLVVTNSYNTSLLALSASTRVVVETIGGQISNSRSRWNGDCSYVVPFFTLIVNMNGGYINGLSWQDDNCGECAAAAYVYSDDGGCNCGVPPSNCIGYNASVTSQTEVTLATANATVSCDLSIYIAYSGTDRNGNVLTSSSRTIANFREYSISALYESAVNYYNNGLPNIGANLSGCKQKDPNTGICLSY